jgi:hypothetical protein
MDQLMNFFTQGERCPALPDFDLFEVSFCGFWDTHIPFFLGWSMGMDKAK